MFFNFNCVVLDVCPVRIGDFTLFGPAVQIYTALHPMDAELRRRVEHGRPVEIGRDHGMTRGTEMSSSPCLFSRLSPGVTGAPGRAPARTR